jgi:diguanylate cyclase
MRYQDTKEQSLEYLRLALPLMTKQLTPSHPISYAIWYEYVSGQNAQLKQDIDARQQSGQLLNDTITVQLFRKHVADVDEATLTRLQFELHRLLSETAECARHSQQDAADYGVTLNQFSQALSAQGERDPGDPLQQTLSLVTQHTVQIRTTIAQLHQALHGSRSEVEALRAELERLHEHVHADALSGLLNRRAFDETLVALLNSANTERSALCLVMFDVDDFKKINDTYGHLFGDRVIRAVAQVLRANTKGRDVAARYGGEEFALLLPQTPITGALGLAQHIRSTVEKASIRRQGSEQAVGRVTVSAGISLYQFGEPAEAFIFRADQALYVSKSGGKNRVTMDESVS